MAELRRAIERQGIEARLRSDHPVLRAVGRARNELFLRRVRRAAPEIARSIPAAAVPATDRAVLSVVRTGTSVAIVTLGARAGSPRAVVLVPQTDSARTLLHRQARNERTLLDDRRLVAWSHRIPRPIHEGHLDGLDFVVETALAGRGALPLLAERTARRELLRHAADIVTDLHGRTAQAIFIGDAELTRWVDEPLETIRLALGERPLGGGERGPTGDAGSTGGRRRDAFVQLRSWLRSALEDRVVTVGWIHGDYWPGNLLLDDGGRISGVVDWDRAGDALPGVHDLLHLVVYTRALVGHVEPGVHVRALLSGADDAWERADRELLAGWRATAERARIAFDALVLVYWLRFVAATFEQSLYFARHPGWVHENVDQVLEAARPRIDVRAGASDRAR